MLQLYDTIQVRHGVMLVGPTAGGKTTCYQVLAKAMSELPGELKREVITTVLNPKALSINELYGNFDELSHEWSDGIVANLVRNSILQYSAGDNKKRWIIFDGPVDAVWIENMNSVLDDNKMLCLSNGERMDLPPSSTMIFEVDNLNAASPATVSRCGMIYVEPKNLGWRPGMIESDEPDCLGVSLWLKNWVDASEDTKFFVYKLFDKFVDPALKFVLEEAKQETPTSEHNLVESLANLFHCLIAHYS